MSLSDWTGEDSGNNKRSIDTSTTPKSGTGSLLFEIVATNNSGKFLTRSVTDPQMQTSLWVQRPGFSAGSTFFINHEKYGSLQLMGDILSGVWRQFRCTFWYDSPNDTKWGRREFRDDEGDAYTEIGTPTNFGQGEPTAGKIRMGGGFSGSQKVFIDDQVVQDRAL